MRDTLPILAAALVACGPAPRDARYAGDHDPCDISVARGPATSEPVLDEDGQIYAALDLFFQPGPYATWNTSPADACADNPVTPPDSAAPGRALYVTYPSVEDPSVTGAAEAAPGPFPLIVFSHANNDTTCSIFERYYGLHDHWASWGAVVLSVDDTDLNCQRGTRQNIADRKLGVLAAVDAARAMNADPDSFLFGRIDLERVVLAGHSRGAGAALLATLETDADAAIALQGISLTGYGFGEPVIETPTLGVTAGIDKDLEYPYVEPTEELLEGPYTWVTIHGGAHAFSSSSVSKEPDEEPTLPRGRQLAITEHYSTALLAQTVGVADGRTRAPHPPRDASSTLASHEGAELMHRRIQTESVSARWRGAHEETTLIDDFDDLGPGTHNLLGLPYEVRGDILTENTLTYDRTSRAYLEARSRLIDASGGPGALLTPLAPPVDPSGARLRARVKRADGAGATRGAEVVLVLENGDEARVSLDEFIGPASLTRYFVQLDVPLEDVVEGSERVRAVGIALESGALKVDDLRL